jgi:hypothetical protein
LIQSGERPERKGESFFEAMPLEAELAGVLEHERAVVVLGAR